MSRTTITVRDPRRTARELERTAEMSRLTDGLHSLIAERDDLKASHANQAAQVIELQNELAAAKAELAEADDVLSKATPVGAVYPAIDPAPANATTDPNHPAA
jgi:hypothetical protein